MKKLILMRHADAQPADARTQDRDRPLSGRGMKQLDEVCPRLHHKMQGLDFVLCSNAKRTRQTLDGIRKILPTTAEIVFEDKIYQGSGHYILERIRRIDDGFKSVLIVGHNPGLQDFLHHCIGGREDIFGTGSLSFFEIQKSFWMTINFQDILKKEIVTPGE